MFFLVEFWAWTLCAEVVLAIQHLLDCYILGKTSQRRSAPVTKFSQSRAWISLKRASAAPQSKLCCVIHFFILIIFRSIIQFLVVLFPLLLWLHQHYLHEIQFSMMFITCSFFYLCRFFFLMIIWWMFVFAYVFCQYNYVRHMIES